MGSMNILPVCKLLFNKCADVRMVCAVPCCAQAIVVMSVYLMNETLFSVSKPYNELLVLHRKAGRLPYGLLCSFSTQHRNNLASSLTLKAEHNHVSP